MNAFDSRLPKTTSYKKDGDIFVVKHTSFMVSKEESEAIAELLMYGIQDRTTKAMLVDNREAKGAWPADIAKMWEFDAEMLEGIALKKTATLTNSTVAAMQINRISRSNGMTEWAKGFHSDLNDEVKAFLLG